MNTPDTVTETIRADRLAIGRVVILSCDRPEVVTAVSSARRGFVEFFTDRRPEGTNLPYTYRVTDTLHVLAVS